MRDVNKNLQLEVKLMVRVQIQVISLHARKYVQKKMREILHAYLHKLKLISQKNIFQNQYGLVFIKKLPLKILLGLGHPKAVPQVVTKTGVPVSLIILVEKKNVQHLIFKAIKNGHQSVAIKNYYAYVKLILLPTLDILLIHKPCLMKIKSIIGIVRFYILLERNLMPKPLMQTVMQIVRSYANENMMVILLTLSLPKKKSILWVLQVKKLGQVCFKMEMKLPTGLEQQEKQLNIKIGMKVSLIILVVLKNVLQ